MEGGGWSWRYGVLLGNWSEGIALPLLGSLPRTPQVWQEVGSLQPCGQVWGCQMLQAGGWWGLRRFALQRDKDTSPQLLCQGAVVLDLLGAVCLWSYLIPISFSSTVSLELAQTALLFRGADSGFPGPLLALPGLTGSITSLYGSPVTRVAWHRLRSSPTSNSHPPPA